MQYPTTKPVLEWRLLGSKRPRFAEPLVLGGGGGGGGGGGVGGLGPCAVEELTAGPYKVYDQDGDGPAGSL